MFIPLAFSTYTLVFPWLVLYILWLLQSCNQKCKHSSRVPLPCCFYLSGCFVVPASIPLQKLVTDQGQRKSKNEAREKHIRKNERAPVYLNDTGLMALGPKGQWAQGLVGPKGSWVQRANGPKVCQVAPRANGSQRPRVLKVPRVPDAQASPQGSQRPKGPTGPSVPMAHPEIPGPQFISFAIHFRSLYTILQIGIKMYTILFHAQLMLIAFYFMSFHVNVFAWHVFQSIPLTTFNYFHWLSCRSSSWLTKFLSLMECDAKVYHGKRA